MSVKIKPQTHECQEIIFFHIYFHKQEGLNISSKTEDTCNLQYLIPQILHLQLFHGLGQF